MKRVLLAALVLIGINAATFAQSATDTKAPEPAKTQPARKAGHKKEKKIFKTDKTLKTDSAAVAARHDKKNERNHHAATPASASKPTADSKPTASASPNPQAGHKPAASTAPAGPVKKDGTPDKRYKANQASASGPAKKDGTPDMRYKANKKKATK